MNVTSYGKGDFADVIKDLELRITCVGPVITTVLIGGRRFDREKGSVFIETKCYAADFED